MDTDENKLVDVVLVIFRCSLLLASIFFFKEIESINISWESDKEKNASKGMEMWELKRRQFCEKRQ